MGKDNLKNASVRLPLRKIVTQAIGVTNVYKLIGEWIYVDANVVLGRKSQTSYCNLREHLMEEDHICYNAYTPLSVNDTNKCKNHSKLATLTNIVKFSYPDYIWTCRDDFLIGFSYRLILILHLP